MKNIQLDEFNDTLPVGFHIAVIMQKEPALNEWLDYQWKVIGVTASLEKTPEKEEVKVIHEKGDTRQYLFSGFKLLLHLDECESYYHNLMSPAPKCYVIAHQHEGEMPVPFMVTLSFDEAHSYLEGDEEIFAVDIPPELYQWVESYVVAHYAPEERKKRKRKDWKKQQ